MSDICSEFCLYYLHVHCQFTLSILFLRLISFAFFLAGLRFLFDVKTTLQISDVAFFPSRTTHSYDLYATSSSKEDILFVDLSDGRVEMITGVGRPAGRAAWGNPKRPIAAAGVFGNYLATTAEGALFVVNGKTRTVNCEIGSIVHPRMMVWVRAPWAEVYSLFSLFNCFASTSPSRFFIFPRERRCPFFFVLWNMNLNILKKWSIVKLVCWMTKSDILESVFV